MASHPYSVRFMSGRGNTREETYTVPEGRRAVVLHVSFVYWSAAGQSSFLFMHGIPVYYYVAPGANEMKFQAVRFTAYERETIKCTVAGSDVSYAVDGFLLADDVGGDPDDADNVIVDLPGLDWVTPLPSVLGDEFAA